MRNFFFNLLVWTTQGIFIILVILIFGFTIYGFGFAFYSAGKWVVNYAQSIPLKAETKQKYPLTHNKYIGEIVEGVYKLQITCLDSFNQKSYSQIKPYISVIDENNEPLDNHRLLIDFAPNAKHRFQTESSPNYCGPIVIKDKIDELGSNKSITLNNQCVRKESAVDLLNSFFPETELDSFYANENEDTFTRKYPSVCELKALDFSPCIDIDYLIPSDGSVKYEEVSYLYTHIVQHFDYFLCDHPEHNQFLSEVKKRWAEKKLADEG